MFVAIGAKGHVSSELLNENDPQHSSLELLCCTPASISIHVSESGDSPHPEKSVVRESPTITGQEASSVCLPWEVT